MIITTEMLRNKKLNGCFACGKHVEMFDELFNGECELTERNIQIAFDNDLDVEWFARAFLPKDAREEYKRARSIEIERQEGVIKKALFEYNTAAGPAVIKFRNAIDELWTMYKQSDQGFFDEKKEAALFEYNNERDEALKEYIRINDTAKKEFAEARLKLLTEILIRNLAQGEKSSWEIN